MSQRAVIICKKIGRAEWDFLLCAVLGFVVSRQRSRVRDQRSENTPVDVRGLPGLKIQTGATRRALSRMKNYSVTVIVILLEVTTSFFGSSEMCRES